MALSLVRNVPESFSVVKKHEWNQIKGKQLSSMTYGILGCGHVGKALVILLKPFGCKILSHDIVDQSQFYKDYGVESVDFKTLISTANVLSIHIPKNDKTKNIISREVLSQMKKGSYLINTARGGLVDEKALLELINQNHLAAAALDVFETEPPVDFSLIDHPKIFTTSHIGGSSEEAILAMGRAAINGLCHFQTASLYDQ
jgi:D-3-phosphoglycerate dehydrogenase